MWSKRRELDRLQRETRASAKQRAESDAPKLKLLAACRKGDVATARELLAGTASDLQLNALRNAPLMQSNPPLHIAAARGDTELLDVLLTAKFDVAMKDTAQQTALHAATKHGRLRAVERLLRANIDLHATDSTGRTALHFAASSGHVDIVAALLNANADVHACTKDGMTPLHYAAVTNRVHVVEFLVHEAHANPNMPSEDGRTPLHAACGYSRSEIVRVLLHAGADMYATDHEGRNALHSCIGQMVPPTPLSNETIKTLQVLVSSGATWDASCDKLVTRGKARPEAQALRICIWLWTQQHVEGIPLTHIPYDVVKRGVHSTQTYLDDDENSYQIVYRLKICLVGPSCAGKTTLVKSIVSKRPQLVHLDNRTIGIDHFPLCLTQVNVVAKMETMYEVTFWDFAGQDAYQIAHSLFFSERTMFLL